MLLSTLEACLTSLMVSPTCIYSLRYVDLRAVLFQASYNITLVSVASWFALDLGAYWNLVLVRVVLSQRWDQWRQQFAELVCWAYHGTRNHLSSSR